MNEQNTKILKLMRFWMFGTFIIVFAGVTFATGYIGYAVGQGFGIFGLPAYWISMGIAAVLCVGGFFGYQWWLTRKA